MLEDWGWDAGWAEALARAGAGPGGEPGRVIGQDRDRWTVRTAEAARPTRRTSSRSVDRLPVVGDWVVVRPGHEPTDPWSLEAVLPRRSTFSRAAAGSGAVEQPVAANVDRVWLVHGLDSPFNPRRMERYLALAWESGASPEIVLTKADIALDRDDAVRAAEDLAFGVPVHAVSVVTDLGIDTLTGALEPAMTVALLGPSGAGKSALVNRLAGLDVAATGEVRAGDRKGRHTTTRRELFRVAGGALLLDTPGMRELQVWTLDEGLGMAFPEIDDLAAACRFRNCAHETEPGCAVLRAVERGELDRDRLESWRKLQAEAAYQARKNDPLAQAEAVSEYRSIMKSLRHHPKYRDRS
jgi:ribosome biogenesis GTPase